MEKKGDFRVAYPVAATYFGVVVGPAMASGVYATTYFSKFGVNAFWLPLVALALVSLTIFMGLNYSRACKCYDWGHFSKVLYGKYYKYINPLYTFYMIIFGIVSMSVMFAMGTSLIQGLLGCNYFIAAIIIGALMIGLMIFGAGLVRNSNVAMSILIIAAMIIFAILSLKIGGPNLKDLMSRGESYPENGTIGSAIMLVIGYGFTMSYNFMAAVTVSQEIKTRKQCGLAAVLAAVLFYGILLCTIFITLPFTPGSLTAATPTLWVVDTYLSENAALLTPLYTILLYLAVLSSGPAILLNQSARWNRVIPDKGIFVHEKAKSFVVAFAFCFVAVMIGQLGLSAIVSKLFTLLGYVGIPMIFLPTVLLTWKRAKQRDADIETE